MDFPDLDFAFVDADDVRMVLEEYYRQTQSALSVGCHLGVIVGCGSVVEGLLTWALLRKEKDALDSGKACKDKQGKVKPLQEWNLSNLIDVSVELDLIGTTAKQASWALKDFRNFIHPHNVLKGSSRPDAALATSALSAVAEIVRSLRGRLPSSSSAIRPLAANQQHDSETMSGETVSMQALNFCWLVPGKLAGCRGPRTEQDLRGLNAIGIRAIVRLADNGEAMVSMSQVEESGIKDCHEPVPDFCAPDLSQVDHALSFVDAALAAGKPVAISCGAGYGRTSTLLACYLVRQGHSAVEAIQLVKDTCGREPERPIQRDIIHTFEGRVRRS